MLLPVSTLAASILISTMPVVSSGDVNVSFASHLSNLPAIVVGDFTSNFIQLLPGVTSNTGACARPHGTKITNVPMHKTTRWRYRLDIVHFIGSLKSGS